MSVTLITDGMLYPLFITEGVHAPDGIEGHLAPRPAPPCGPIGIDPDAPPQAPLLALASGPYAPVPPCGETASDPTITPPAVPAGPEAGLTPDQTGPKIPRCPEGRQT